MTVEMTQVALLSGAGQIAFIDLTNPGANYTSRPTITFSGAAFITEATAEADINLAGVVTNIRITNPGSGYTSAPTMTFSAPTNPPVGSLGVTADAKAYVGSLFPRPLQNESFGPAGTSIAMTALAVGTFPIGGFTYEFFVDGISIGLRPGIPVGTPASIGWSPPQPGSYFLTVKATDGLGHDDTSLPIRYHAVGTLLTSPTPNTIVPNGSSVAIQATAMPQPLQGGLGGNNAFVRRMEFYADGVLVGTDETAPYSLIYTPSPSATHVVEARAFDNNNNQVSPDGTTTLNLFMVPPIGTPPTSIITSPANNAVIAIPSGGASIPIVVAAGSPTGQINKVELFIDGVLFGTDVTFPYEFNWTPTVVGSYRMIALAYDDKSNVVASSIAPATTTLLIAAQPTVNLDSPIGGTSIGIGAATTLVAAANDSNVGGGIARVQFFAGSTFVGESTAPSGNRFSISWSPSAPGATTITAVATNSLGLSSSSSGTSVTVLDAPPATQEVVIPDKVAKGLVVGGSNSGSFTATHVGGKTVTLVGNLTANGATTTYFFPGVLTAEGGAFSATNAQGQSISGTFSDTGAFGSINGDLAFSGAVVFPGANPTVTPGFYTGNIAGRSDSALSAIVGADRSIALHLTVGDVRSTATGVVDSAGVFSLNAASGVFSGKVDPATGFLTGSFSGPSGGQFLAAKVSGGVGNGVLPNLSTRGQVGAGNNVLTAGFVVGGTVAKQILIRAVGPSLAPLGIANAIANPQLEVFRGTTLVGSNDNWGGAANLVTASAQVGAFALSGTSLDSVVLATLAPGNYTAQVSGVGGVSGIGLVELYDADPATLSSPKKVINISTRGMVGPDQAQLVAGFVVNGSTPKKVLIRAAGPALGVVAPGLAVLADPMLRLFRLQQGAATSVRENDNWETGNDGTLVRDAASSVGAFSYAAGSRDAAILISLPPGTYSAVVSGPGTSTGLAIIEVYEVR